MNIKVGTQFRSSFADSNPMWTVVEKRGRGTWIAEINSDELDYAGSQAAFTTEQIAGSIQWSEAMKKSSDDSDTFFDRLTPGTIVHYNNGFHAYVRCKVTSDHQLLPIALVGDWKEYDLPKRGLDGSIYLGYHVENIKEGKTFRPHASNVWEYNLTKTKNQQPIAFSKWSDPTELKPVSLKVPDMNPKQALEAAKHIKLDRIRNIIKTAKTPDDTFWQLRTILAE